MSEPISDEEKQWKAELGPEAVGPQKPKYGWARWDPVLAQKIITDNFDLLKRLTEDKEFKG
jgi:hypothetical protein